MGFGINVEIPSQGCASVPIGQSMTERGDRCKKETLYTCSHFLNDQQL